VAARDDFHALETDQYDAELNDGLPAELVGALRTLSEAFNPNPTVQQFVWALKPIPVTDPPTTYLQAVGRGDGDGEAVSLAEGNRMVSDYMVSVGLLSSEQSRRAMRHVPRFTQSDGLPAWKRRALSVAYRSPRSAAAFQKAYRWIR